MKILKCIGYWFLQVTWGVLMTIPGLLVILFSIIFLKGKAHRNGYSCIVEVGGDWGGLNLGAFSLCGRYSQKDGPCYDPYWYEHTRRHEFGHSIQNIIFGPLMFFIVDIPSFIRYHIFNYRIKHGLPNKPYDSIWFEGTATKWGTSAIECIEYGVRTL